MFTRKFPFKTAWLSYPMGMSPNDSEGIKFAERALRQMTGADNVQVSFDHGPDGQPMLDHMKVYCEYPTKQGQYVSLAAIDSNVAHLLGDIIEDLAQDKDISAALDKLKNMTSKGNKPGEEKPEEESADDKEKPSFPGSEDKSDSTFPPKDKSTPSESPSGVPSGSSPSGFPPQPNKPRIPTSRKSILKNASDLSKKHRISMKDAVSAIKLSKNGNTDSCIRRCKQLDKQYGMGFSDALEVVKTAARCEDFSDFYKEAREAITDEDNKPLSKEEYIKMGAIARGIPNPLERKK